LAEIAKEKIKQAIGKYEEIRIEILEIDEL
jgi:hypothetical protein